MGLNGHEWREFERAYAEIVSLQNADAAFQKITAAVPQVTGLEVSFFGDLIKDNRMVLRYPVNGQANVIEGIVVPAGAGLGGKVLTSKRPEWVADYSTASSITHQFNSQVLAEGVRGMAAAPISHGDRLFGVLYGATRTSTDFGDRAADALMTIAARAATAAIAAERARYATEVAVAQERRRLALELHDTVGGMLFTIGAGIRRLGDDMAGDDTASTRVKVIGGQVAQASIALRSSMRTLSSPPEQIALSVALRQDCQAFEERTGIPARLLTLNEMPSLKEQQIMALTRAVREALLNVEKHAAARSVIVSAFAVPGRAVVAVSDDGVGLAAERASGLGLTAVGERLNRVGGDLSVGPGDDGGVTVQAWIPTRD